ncbi:MAG: hypothetical protein AAGA75_02375 [Cyanobacteria bacterium P01_E01_bin.6]
MTITTLSLNLVEGSVSFSFTPSAAEQLKAELVNLVNCLKTVAGKSGTGGTSRPTPQKSLEYQYAGDVFLEIFCNPNIWPSPFAAKVLVTVRDERIRLSTEAELTRVIEDVNQYLEHAR